MPETPRDAHAPASSSAQPGGSPPVPHVSAAKPATPGAERTPGLPRGEVTAALAAVIGGGLVTLALLFGRGHDPADGSALRVDAAGIVPSAASAAPSAPGRWSNGSHSRWKSDRPKDVVLELPADNKVSVWMKHVRPMLVVRCMNRSTEAFVFTESAAAIETQDENHTVHISFDGEPAATERWPDSVEHDALFAPDGASFARRIARAKTMSFAFRPHNALPVEATFNVSGFDALIAPAAKQCGWN